MCVCGGERRQHYISATCVTCSEGKFSIILEAKHLRIILIYSHLVIRVKMLFGASKGKTDFETMAVVFFLGGGGVSVTMSGMLWNPIFKHGTEMHKADIIGEKNMYEVSRSI